jgi:DDE superfamily endonuclease
MSPDSAPVIEPTRSPTASVCEPFFDFIELSLGKGRNAKAIFQDLVDDYGFAARYRASSASSASCAGHSVRRPAWSLSSNQVKNPVAVAALPHRSDTSVCDSQMPRQRLLRLKRHPRFHVHFTPTSSSWLNMVERFFRDLTQNRLRRGVFRDVDPGQQRSAFDCRQLCHTNMPRCSGCQSECQYRSTLGALNKTRLRPLAQFRWAAF